MLIRRNLQEELEYLQNSQSHQQYDFVLISIFQHLSRVYIQYYLEYQIMPLILLYTFRVVATTGERGWEEQETYKELA